MEILGKLNFGKLNLLWIRIDVTATKSLISTAILKRQLHGTWTILLVECLLTVELGYAEQELYRLGLLIDQDRPCVCFADSF